MPTYVPPVKTLPSRWHVIDANGKVLGRVATHAAKLLQGKHKAAYTPYLDTGDHVVILNVAKMGHFSSDRTIMQYAEQIWGAKPISR